MRFHSSFTAYLLLTVLASCSDDTTTPKADAGPDLIADHPVACTYDGRQYADGVEFPAADGCNSCKCNPTGTTPGKHGCSLKACPDSGADAETGAEVSNEVSAEVTSDSSGDGAACTGPMPTFGCANAGANRCCDDVFVNHLCQNGQWVCPANMITFTACCGVGPACQPYPGTQRPATCQVGDAGTGG